MAQDIRTTKVFLETLSVKNPEIRVTKVWVEVLRSVSDNIPRKTIALTFKR